MYLCKWYEGALAHDIACSKSLHELDLMLRYAVKINKCMNKTNKG